jgi:hypothetical protein
MDCFVAEFIIGPAKRRDPLAPRNDDKDEVMSSPPSTRSCAWRGGVGGGGSIRLLLWQRVCGAAPHPRPLPAASRGEGERMKRQRFE